MGDTIDFESDQNTEETRVEFISALDDAEIRLSCFRLISTLYKDDQEVEFAKTLAEAMTLYEWVMGADEIEIEEAAEPASVPTSEPCDPKPH